MKTTFRHEIAEVLTDRLLCGKIGSGNAASAAQDAEKTEKGVEQYG